MNPPRIYSHYASPPPCRRRPFDRRSGCQPSLNEPRQSPQIAFSQNAAERRLPAHRSANAVLPPRMLMPPRLSSGLPYTSTRAAAPGHRKVCRGLRVARPVSAISRMPSPRQYRVSLKGAAARAADRLGRAARDALGRRHRQPAPEALAVGTDHAASRRRRHWHSKAYRDSISDHCHRVIQRPPPATALRGFLFRLAGYAEVSTTPMPERTGRARSPARPTSKRSAVTRISTLAPRRTFDRTSASTSSAAWVRGRSAENASRSSVSSKTKPPPPVRASGVWREWWPFRITSPMGAKAPASIRSSRPRELRQVAVPHRNPFDGAARPLAAAPPGGIQSGSADIGFRARRFPSRRRERYRTERTTDPRLA